MHKKQYRKEQIVVGDATMVKCWLCNTYKNYDEFYSTCATRCRACICGSIQYTPRPFIKQLIRNARKRHNKNFPKDQFEMNHESVGELILAQGGRGYYSGVPLLFHSGNFQVIFERLNNSIGYSTSNVVLEAQEFNTSDMSSVATFQDVVCGSAQWNRDKMILWHDKRFNGGLHLQLNTISGYHSTHRIE